MKKELKIRVIGITDCQGCGYCHDNLEEDESFCVMISEPKLLAGAGKEYPKVPPKWCPIRKNTIQLEIKE